MAALTNLAQIKGGVALQNRVTALETSYQAAKVLTTIAKTGATATGNYNVDELLDELKTGLADLLGDGSGEGLSLTSLNTDLTNLKQKYVKDAVRVQATATYTAGDPGSYAITLPQDFDLTEVAPSFDDETELRVYTLNNETVFDTSGNHLTYDFKTNSFSGTPAKLDVATSKADTTNDALHYTALNETFQFKVFPTGRFQLADIPEDALLDNEELQLIAYDQALQKIIIELARDDDVIAAITEKVGASTVANQIAAVTDPLDTRLTDVEAFVSNNQDRLDAVEAMFVPQYDVITVQNGSEEDPETHETVDTPMHSFTLTSVPNATKVKMYINSLTYIEDEHFTVNRSTKVVTWTFTAASTYGFDITEDLADKVIFEYFTGTAVAEITAPSASANTPAGE